MDSGQSAAEFDLEEEVGSSRKMCQPACEVAIMLHDLPA